MEANPDRERLTLEYASHEILTVGALTDLLRNCLERRFPFVWLRGEVTNFSQAASGHIYFSLKDDRAQIQCVWFAGKQQKSARQKFDPLTGEVFETPQPPALELIYNGAQLLCAGQIGVFAARGTYQILVDLVQPAGQGMLAQAFEERKALLAKAGYFDTNRKRPLPANPSRIALVTSLHGAAIHDFLRLAHKRGTGSAIRIFPVPVQGADAATKIAEAIGHANLGEWAQVIVVIRGGGSLEDLWAFNETPVAQAIFESRLPVLAGIGHEIDHTLADMTADMRAATPSHAAQLLWPLRSEMWQSLDSLQLSLKNIILQKFAYCESELRKFVMAIEWLSPAQKLIRHGDRLRALRASLHRTMENFFDRQEHRFKQADISYRNAARLQEKLLLGQQKLMWLDKNLAASITAMVTEKAHSLRNFGQALSLGINRQLADKKNYHEKLAATLKGYDPQIPLNRGYALLYHGQTPLRSVSSVSPGDHVMALLGDGRLGLNVTSVNCGTGNENEQT